MSKKLTAAKHYPYVPGTDFTQKELDSLNSFMAEGMPGYGSVNEATLQKMVDDYLIGKTYSQISRANNLRKEIVLYASHKHHWLELRTVRQNQLNDSLDERIAYSEIDGRHFIVDMDIALRKYFKAQIEGYHRTGDNSYIALLDTKLMEKYLKIHEIILSGDIGKAPQIPSPVGINPGPNGVTVSKNEDGSMDITPKADMSEILKNMSEAKKAKEKEAQAVKLADINSRNNKTDKGESNES